jgi:hypothetical protein
MIETKMGTMWMRIKPRLFHQTSTGRRTDWEQVIPLNLCIVEMEQHDCREAEEKEGTTVSGAR